MTCPLLNKQQRQPTMKNLAVDFDHNHDVEEEIFDQVSCPGFFASHACLPLLPRSRERGRDYDKDKNEENGTDGLRGQEQLQKGRGNALMTI
jgi:hypothetical protein